MSTKSQQLFVVLLFTLLFFIVSTTSAESESKSILEQPHALPSFNLTYIQNYASCSYTVVITTSCSSVSHTRDQISISFGDAYGNQIYAPRIDDPSTRTFEQCSTDTYTITGPCAYQICYVYLYRSGTDGWKPDSVTISGDYSKSVTFYYKTFIPNNVWYGFNLCHSASSSRRLTIQTLLLVVTLAFVQLALL